MKQPTTLARWSIITTAVLVVLAACAPAATTTTQGTVPAAASTTAATAVSPSKEAAVEIANLFVAAYAANDADSMATYLTSEVPREFGGSLEGLRLEVSFNQAQGFKHMFDSCMVQETSPSGTTVRCPYDYHGIRSDEMGLGPYTGSWYDLVCCRGNPLTLWL
ncbi:MAG: hypothetical protein ACREA0_23395 [bacterium]